MFGRSVLFIGWGCVGLAWAYAALYILTPFGLTIAAGAGLVAVALHAAGGPPRSEAIGLAAGAGALFLLWATNPDPPGAALPVGIALVVASAVTFGIVARRSAHRR